MSFIKDLFGGTEQSSSSTSIPKDVTPEEFKALRQPVADELLRFLSGGATPGGGAFPGTFAAPVTGQEQGLISSIPGLISGGAPGAAASDLLTKTLQGDFLNPQSNPFLAATIAAAQRPLVEQFRDVTIPGLTGAFTAAGQQVQGEGSSAFGRNAAIASRGLASALADISTNLSGQNFQAERARQQESIETSSKLTAQNIENTVKGLQASALPRLVEQFGIDRGLEEFNRQITVALQAIQLSQGLPLFASQLEGQSQSKGTVSPNIVGTLLGSGGVSSLFPTPAPPGGVTL